MINFRSIPVYKKWRRKQRKWRRISYRHSAFQMQKYQTYITGDRYIPSLTIRQLGILFLQATRVQACPLPSQWQFFAFITQYQRFSGVVRNSTCLVTTNDIYAEATRESALLANTYFRVGEQRGALSNRLKTFCNITPGMGLFKHVILLNSSGSDNFLRELRVQTNLYGLFTVFRRMSKKRLINYSVLQDMLQRDESLYLVFLYIYLTGHVLSRFALRF